MLANIQHDFVNQIDAKVNKRHVRPYLKCIIQGSLEIKKGLYDTGSDLTCMRMDKFREIPIEARPKKALNRRVKCSGANTGALAPLGIYDMALTIEGKTIVHPVVVMRDLNEDFILGEDFIEPNELFHNPIRHQYRWGEP